MKKIALLVGMLSVSLATYAALPTDAGELQVNVPMLKPGIELGADLLFFKASDPELDYALVFPADSANGGRFRSPTPNYDVGYRLLLGYLFPGSGSDLRLTYTGYEQRERDRAIPAGGELVPTLGGLISFSTLAPAVVADIVLMQAGILQAFPGVTLLAPKEVDLVATHILEADAKGSIRQGCVDLDTGQFMNIDSFMRLRLFGGLRYSRIKTRLISTYLLQNFLGTEAQSSGPYNFFGTNVAVLTTTTVTSNSQLQEMISQSSKFDGLGPRFGVEGTFHLSGGFGLVGKLAGALLIGNTQNYLSQAAAGTLAINTGAVNVTSLSPDIGARITSLANPALEYPATVNVFTAFDYDKTTRIVPNLEARLGLDYTYALKDCRFFTLEVGYFVNHYFGATDHLGAASLSTNGFSAESTADISFSGPYLELSATL